MNKQITLSSTLVEEARQLATQWHGGQWTLIYAFASTGVVEDAEAFYNEVEWLMLEWNASAKEDNEWDPALWEELKVLRRLSQVLAGHA